MSQNNYYDWNSLKNAQGEADDAQGIVLTNIRDELWRLGNILTEMHLAQKKAAAERED